MTEKIKAEELRIEKLEPKHKELLISFQTSNKELKDFLVEDALKNHDIAVSTTYLWFYTPTNQLAAYTTLLTDSLRIGKTELEKAFVDKGVLYKSLPALKIGRLCVDDKFKGKGIGTQTTYFVMSVLLSVTDYAGCRFIVLDAKPEAVEFYKKLGFQILKHGEIESTPMYYDMKEEIELYRKGNFKLSEHFLKIFRAL